MERAELMKLVRATGCAETRGAFVFLCDPNWSAAERVRVEAIMGHAKGLAAANGWLCVRTGGTSGAMKFARHDEQSLIAAARGFCAHFEVTRVNAIDVLPAHHVSGLMARVRCAMTGGVHVPWPWKRLEAGERPELAGASDGWVISLVPTQLRRLMASPEAIDWLRQFKIIFLGGGPVWPELADAAMNGGLRISLSYGMTETAAMVAALKPEEFLAGERSCGAPLPHARISLSEEGTIAIEAESVFRGYFPDEREGREFVTADLGRIDVRGHLEILRRMDNAIISGGKKVQPAEVEAALQASGQFADVAVIGVPDVEWGEAVVACYSANASAPNFVRAVAALARFQRPKRFIEIAAWPRNAQGKINRIELLAAVTRAISSGGGNSGGGL